MCGIVGYVGPNDPVPVLVEGLKRLEYRGYDSAGVALGNGSGLVVRRAKGKITNLEDKLRQDPASGTWGIGHTRWATHGRPSEENAHPHTDCQNKLVVVHNGIIENYLELKQGLEKRGHVFRTETDTETIAHLLEEAWNGSLAETLRAVVRKLHGIYALAVIHADAPGEIAGTRSGPPLIVGLGENENFVASDISAILSRTRRILNLKDGEIVHVKASGVAVTSLDGAPVDRPVETVTWDPVMAEKAGYRHFMLKEIHEQPRAIQETLAGRVSVNDARVYLDDLQLTDADFARVKKVNLLACGTSWHAALVGKFMIEDIARVPVEVDYGSEYRYRDPIVDKDTLTVIITQSGETADTLAALKEARDKGSMALAVCNVVGSMATREVQGTILTHAGPEIGVASTKAFTCQLLAMYLLALHLGRMRGTLPDAELKAKFAVLQHLPAQLEQVLKTDEALLQLARRYHKASDFLYLGRGMQYPIALEGALKLKEISYIHAEGYPAGEMKHGPIALIDSNLPVVCVCLKDKTYDKMRANLKEVKARDGIVIALATEGDTQVAEEADHVVYIPAGAGAHLEPILAVVPFQLLAYHIAVLRGCDVDQPRNLAKSVTVE